MSAAGRDGLTRSSALGTLRNIGCQRVAHCPNVVGEPDHQRQPLGEQADHPHCEQELYETHDEREQCLSPAKMRFAFQVRHALPGVRKAALQVGLENECLGIFRLSALAEGSIGELSQFSTGLRSADQFAIHVRSRDFAASSR